MRASTFKHSYYIRRWLEKENDREREIERERERKVREGEI